MTALIPEDAPEDTRDAPGLLDDGGTLDMPVAFVCTIVAAILAAAFASWLLKG